MTKAEEKREFECDYSGCEAHWVTGLLSQPRTPWVYGWDSGGWYCCRKHRLLGELEYFKAKIYKAEAKLGDFYEEE